MCKHILFNDFNHDTDLNTLYRFVDQTYDKDGFGAIIRSAQDKIYTYKSLDKTEFYMTLGAFLSKNTVKTLVIHHRTSTNGNGIDYAHPFEFQGNYLTHNGVVTVPGHHDTLTTNDSEELLHHLIKTGFDTVSIQGYFSCFILNEKETIVLADDRAPMYTSRDGRVFSSHKLGKKWKPIVKKRIHIPLDGSQRVSFDIQVSESNYGMDKAYLSLGSGRGGWDWDETLGKAVYRAAEFDDPYRDDQVGEFLDYIRWDEEEEILACKTFISMCETIKEKAWNLGLKLTPSQIEELADLYIMQDQDNRGESA